MGSLTSDPSLSPPATELPNGESCVSVSSCSFAEFGEGREEDEQYTIGCKHSGYQHRKLVKSVVSGVRDGFVHGLHDFLVVSFGQVI